MTTTATAYGYGHTKEAAALVRAALAEGLKKDRARYDLKISVRTPGRGHNYGGPRVEITTTAPELDRRYQYFTDPTTGEVVDRPGVPAVFQSRPVHEFKDGRPHHTARLVFPPALEDLNKRVRAILEKFGRDNDDAMTDYFNNTQPLFYGVTYERKK